jgi:hypothetical protein
LPWFPLSFSTSCCWSPGYSCASCSIGRGPATPPRARRHPSPPLYRQSVTLDPSLWRGSPPSRTATPVHPAVPLTPRHPQSRHPTSCPREGAVVRSTPHAISARTRTVRIGVGSPGGISAPMAIPMGGPGDSCCVSPVAAIFSRPCAVKAHGRNVVRPWGMQVPHEPMELSSAGHLAL